MITSDKTHCDNDFGCFIAREQAFCTAKFAQIEQDHSEKAEKATVGKKDRKKACAKNWDPYNAPPLRRQCETLHKMVVTTQRKILKNGVDSERGKRNIR
ncbi:hypothetical protein, partial [Superficieibacter sp.]|uniref:hypothetical protein n=1 Tax=Superficieibacter sp. TaxID=2303322 RepID=UPI0028AD05B3